MPEHSAEDLQEAQDELQELFLTLNNLYERYKKLSIPGHGMLWECRKTVDRMITGLDRPIGELLRKERH